jgi:molybdopterin converting factor small subunit
MAMIYLHAIVKELAGRSAIVCNVERPMTLGDVFRANLSERELFLIVDETGAIRKHLNVFADARKLRELDSIVLADAAIDVFPAVSGG